MAGRFTFHADRCTGCQACVVACRMEHRERQTRPWRQVHTFNPFRHPALPVFHLSLACHHCEDPACLRHCPADAYARDAATGAVVIDPGRCMGCRYCTWACPHDAPKFDPLTGTIEKCTFCRERLERGLEPACVARCPVEALGYEEGRDPAEAVTPPGFPASDLRPAIRFAPMRSTGPDLARACDPSLLARFLDQVLKLPEEKITLRGEWSLVAFTTIITVLVAWQAASLLGGPAIRPWSFLAAGGGALVLSAWHLGRKFRAWRALANISTSWLSREILLVSAFLGTAGIRSLGVGGGATGLTAAVLGFGALFAIDRIYGVALKAGLHSAHTLLNGLFLLGLLAGLWPLALLAGVMKGALYVHRKVRFARTGRDPRWAGSLLRLVLGLVSPALLAFSSPSLGALAAVLGDLVDRCEFYDELEIPTPEKELHRTLGQRLG